MGYAMIAAPGTEYGPCKEMCTHVDCEVYRDMANEICRFCGKPIGYERAYYRDPDASDPMVHASCLEPRR